MTLLFLQDTNNKICFDFSEQSEESPVQGVHMRKKRMDGILAA